MRGITPESASWLSVLKNYRRTVHWTTVEQTVLTKHQYNCAQCGVPATTVKHNTYLTIGTEADTDAIPYCSSCRKAAGSNQTSVPGYLSIEVKAAMTAFLAANPPQRVTYMKANRTTPTSPAEKLQGSNSDIVHARSVYLSLYEYAIRRGRKKIRVQRSHIMAHSPMHPRMVTRALNVLQNAGWIYRFTKLEQKQTGEYKSSIIVELKKIFREDKKKETEGR